MEIDNNVFILFCILLFGIAFQYEKFKFTGLQKLNDHCSSYFNGQYFAYAKCKGLNFNVEFEKQLKCGEGICIK